MTSCRGSRSLLASELTRGVLQYYSLPPQRASPFHSLACRPISESSRALSSAPQPLPVRPPLSPMSLRKRMSVSSTRSVSPMVFSGSPNPEAEEWVKTWEQVQARGTHKPSSSQRARPALTRMPSQSSLTRQSLPSRRIPASRTHARCGTSRLLDAKRSHPSDADSALQRRRMHRREQITQQLPT